jgi:hypothetical protein
LSAQDTAGEAPGPGHGSDDPAEEELRAAYEAELSRITTTDMMAQAAVSLLNIGARRLAPSGGGEAPGTGGAQAQRDLEQARDAIDAVRALLEILERRVPRELGPLRDALSRLQMSYAREVAPGAGGAGGPEATDAGGAEATNAGAGASGGERPAPAGTGRRPDGEQPPSGESPRGPGPAESSGRLWVPGR